MTLDGLVVPVPTMFGPEGELNVGANSRFTRRLCDARVDHLFVLGSLGEFLSVDDVERKKMIDAVLESLTWKTDAWVGVGAAATARAVRYAVAAEEVGAEALVALPPYYLAPTEAAVAEYYRAIRAATRIPLLAYNNPARVGYALSPALVHALAGEKIINGLKDTSGSVDSLRSFLTGAPPGFAVLPGDDPLVLASVEQGAPGAVMRTANIAPKLTVDLLAAARSGARPEAERLQGIATELYGVTKSGPYPATVKFLAARLRSMEVGYRAPYGPLRPAEEATVLAALQPLEERLRPFL